MDAAVKAGAQQQPLRGLAPRMPRKGAGQQAQRRGGEGEASKGGRAAAIAAAAATTKSHRAQHKALITASSGNEQRPGAILAAPQRRNGEHIDGAAVGLQRCNGGRREGAIAFAKGGGGRIVCR